MRKVPVSEKKCFNLTQSCRTIQKFQVYVASLCYLGTLFEKFCKLEGSNQSKAKESGMKCPFLMGKFQCFTSETLCAKSVKRNVSTVRIIEWFNIRLICSWFLWEVFAD